MTEKQYKEYTEIKKEIDNLKRFLSMCGKKYYNKAFDYRYRIRLLAKKIRFLAKKRSFAVGRVGLGWVNSEEYELPTELQSEIIDVIERYVECREKDLEVI